MCSAVIDACGKRGDIGMAEKLLQEMQQDAKLQPDVFTYTVLMDAYGKAGELKKMWNLFGDVKKTKRQLQSVVPYSVVIKACMKNGAVDDGTYTSFIFTFF